MTVPSGKEVVVTDTALYMVMDSACAAVAELASVTCTVKLLVPAADGVPLITPVPLFNVNPDGSVPALIPQLYGVLPPAAVKV